MEFTGERLIPDDPSHRDLYWEHAARYELAAPLAPGKRALDLGCGCGYGTARLAEAGAAAALGLDLSEAALAYAARYQRPGLRFVRGDARQTGLPDGGFDLIVSFELIEHLAAQEALVAEIKRLLARDGLALISTPEAARPDRAPNPWHVKELTRADFEALLRGRFANVRLLGQRRFAGMAFAAADEPAAAADPGAAGPLRGAAAAAESAAPSYWIAVCSDAPLPALAGLIETPHFQNLDELRAHLATRDADVAARDERIDALQREVAEKTAWGQALDDRTRELERDAQDRDVRLVLLARERDAVRATLGYRLHAKLAPAWRRLRLALRGLGRAAFFFSRVGLALLASLPAAAAAGPRLMAAAEAWALARRARRELERGDATCGASPPQAAADRPGAAGGAPALAVAREALAASIVIPSYNDRDLLERYLPSVIAEAARCPFPTEILVVDDAGEDGAAAWLAAAYPQVRVVRLAVNQGFGAAANRGVQEARRQIVYLCNSDMELAEGALRAATETLAQTGAFAVASAIVARDGEPAGPETGLTTGRWTHGSIKVRHEGDLGAEARSTLYAGGGAAAFDRAAFLALGGFRPLYRPYYAEDLDLSYRAWLTGRIVLVEPRSRVMHQRRGAIGRTAGPRRIERRLHANLLLFQWANLDRRLLRDHLRGLPWAALRGQVDRATLRAAAERYEAALALRRQRPSAGAWSDTELLAGAGSRAWDLAQGIGLTRSPSALRRGEGGVDAGDIPQAGGVANGRRGFSPPSGGKGSGERASLKVLAVAPYCPWPPTHGGAARMWELLTRMAQRHEVHLAAMIEREAEAESRAALERHFARVHLQLRGRADPAPAWWPASVAEFKSHEFERAVDRMVGEEDYDLIQAEYPILAHALPYGGRAKILLTEIDVYHVAYRRAAQAARTWSARALAEYERLRMFRYEAEHADRADLLLAMSEDDARACRAFTSTPVATVPNGADPTRLAFSPRPPRPHEVLFVGHFRHPPNVDGARWFAREVWPRVRDADWRARLIIAGAEPPPEVARLAHDPTIRVTGFVPDLSPLWRGCAAFVAPIRRGSGTRVKILEAMAAGAPVVATGVGIEGIAAEPGRHFLLADAPEAFAAACLRLLADAGERERLATAARRLVEEQYDWDAVADRLDRVWRDLCRRNAAGERTAARGTPRRREGAGGSIAPGEARSPSGPGAPVETRAAALRGALDGQSQDRRRVLIVQTCNPDLLAHVIRDARRRFPRARLTVLRQRGMAPYLPDGLPVDEWLDNPRTGRLALARDLRRRDFDAACLVESGEHGFWKLKLLPWIVAPSAVFLYDRQAQAVAVGAAALAGRLLGDWVQGPPPLTARRLAAPIILWRCWRFRRRRARGLGSVLPNPRSA